VLQTAIDLVEKGFKVIVVADAVGSRQKVDFDFALDRLKQGGVFITSVEAILLELTRDSKHPKFKSISKLIK
jgi:nicotinamidase-related amidase